MSIDTPRELTVRTNKKGFLLWAKEVGWKHVVAWMMMIYALFPILYIISTSLTDFGGIENAALFQQFHYQNYIDLFNDPSYPFAQWMMNTLIIAVALQYSLYSSLPVQRIHLAGYVSVVVAAAC